MLTAPERARAQKFTAGMASATAQAVINLFTITKPGDHKSASELIAAAHTADQGVSAPATGVLGPLGLVRSNGTIPEAIKHAVRRAVREGYLIIKGPKAPELKPGNGYMDRTYE